MNSTTLVVVQLLLFLTSHLQSSPAFGLSSDGGLLLSFKYAILGDPSGVLADWNYDDDTPCSWNGVVCMDIGNATRVISLVLPGVRLVGSLPPDLGLVEHLRHIDLSGNSLNDTLPATLFNASELRVLSLASNAISGELPEAANAGLRVLNLSNNAFTGRIPGGIAGLRNLTTLSLSNNYLSGELPNGGFERIEILDFSSNLLNGSLPEVLGGDSLSYLNLSYNRLGGEIPVELGSAIPANATVDLSFNNLTGEVPASGAFLSQKPEYFAGNPNLCGKLMMVLCPHDTEAPQPSASTPTSPPAFAVIPKIPNESTPPEAEAKGGGGQQRKRGGLSREAVVAIVVGDIAGIGLLFTVLLYVYKAKKKRKQQLEMGAVALHKTKVTTATAAMPSSSETKECGAFSCCLTNKCGCGDGCEDSSDSTDSSEMDGEQAKEVTKPPATLVSVDSEMELEMETLLRASAYVLGVPGPSIVYKAVLDDGTALAVRRIGESSSIGKLKDFESQVRGIARLRHPNLLRLRGFYWAPDEKLLISDFAPNGSLANISFAKKLGSSPFHLSWAARLRIARGVARALAFLHDKRCVHGNLKPSNILLTADMEPLVADFGLDRLVAGGNKSGRIINSARHHFGSKRSLFSQTSSIPEQSPTTPGPTPSPGGPSTLYQAPESLQNLKISTKWDVFAFGMVVLELMAGRAFAEAEVAEWNAGFVEEGGRVVRMADPAIRGEVQGREEAMVGCFRLGFSCAAGDPGRRPAMKEAVQVLDRVLMTVVGGDSL